MMSIWDLYAMVYDSLPKHFKPYQELVKEIVREVSKCSVKGRVLDAGCGTGNYSIALAKLGYDVIGVDFSESMLMRAEKKKKSIDSGKLRFNKVDTHGQARGTL
jgi:2-polyprenyl-3-methyl-5-hydroxy-6-metoxy-1,4-benzoquinol methylase